MPSGHGGLRFASGSFTSTAYDTRLYFEKKFKQTNGDVQPETRLIMTMPAAFLFPVSLLQVSRWHGVLMIMIQISLFWFAWTANKTFWLSPVIATSIFGIGAVWTIMPVLLYLPQGMFSEITPALPANPLH
jgi:DHA1 family multidrug resistance protein-like MFS transporter